MRQLFADGMSTKYEAMLDRTQFTQHFTRMRQLCLLASGDEFCGVFGQFGQGLVEMDKKLQPPEAVKTE